MNHRRIPKTAIATILGLRLVAGPVLPATAGISSGPNISPVIVVAEQAPKPVGISLTIPADYISVPLRVTSGQKVTTAAYDETRQALDVIAKKAREGGRIHTSTGVTSLSEHRSGFGISSGGWNQPAASANIYLLVPMSTNNGDIFQAGAEAARLVESLTLPGKAKCELGTLQLAVENPEQYRAKILALISEEDRKTRDALSPGGSATIAGLESPVLVQQVDDRNVRVFLNYSMSLSDKK